MELQPVDITDISLVQGCRVTLSLGSNCCNRRRAVADAIEWLSGLLGEFSYSEIYETQAVGHTGPDYMNAVVSGISYCPIGELEKSCKQYECEHGRDAESRRLNRVPIDIDIVTVDDMVLRPGDFNCSFFQLGYRSLGVLHD